LLSRSASIHYPQPNEQPAGESRIIRRWISALDLARRRAARLLDAFNSGDEQYLSRAVSETMKEAERAFVANDLDRATMYRRDANINKRARKATTFVKCRRSPNQRGDHRK
jgi:hypothetical protein